MNTSLTNREVTSIIRTIMDDLSVKEGYVEDALLTELKIPKRKTRRPLIVGMIGLVGSGKSTVARELAGRIGAAVIEADRIRVVLRKCRMSFDRTRLIAENLALEALERGGNVVIDADFVDAKKRKSLLTKARKVGARVVFVATYCDDARFDNMIGRVVINTYSEDDLFGGAPTTWKGDAETRGRIVKLREMMRRLPRHYRWEDKNGGRWLIKKPPCRVVADIDTSESGKWRRQVAVCAKKLLRV